ncbi:ficolin-1-like [Clytia hemisphaerica]|uniref:Fibrinogen C-terminal domain-containing protein n=1 Tax=Clytia hemisphaerica TaxID=252671 RepID=A0A7M5UXS2_9CNID
MDHYIAGARATGVYKITLPSGPKEVRCNMEIDGGGWLVFLRRFDGSVDFYDRDWDDYKNGFGSASTEMWLGNEHLHSLTTWRQHEVYIHAGRFPPNQDEVKFSKYDIFKVESESDNYQLKGGTLIDGIHSLESNFNEYFSTREKDNDSCFSNGNECR